MKKIIDIDDLRIKQWKVGEAVCMKCGYIWGVVAPIDVCEMFECPECGLMLCSIDIGSVYQEGTYNDWVTKKDIDAINMFINAQRIIPRVY